MSWSSVAGRTYAVETSAVAEGPFVSVADGIVATPPFNTVVVPAESAGYIRITVGTREELDALGRGIRKVQEMFR